MSKFVVKNIESVKGYQQFKQLVIVDNDTDVTQLQLDIDKNKVILNGVLDEYESSLEKKYEKSFRGIIAIMNRISEGHIVSETKFKDVTPHGEITKEFEIKYQDLRVLAIKIRDGKLVLLGGYKNNQKKDFGKFRSLKAQYLEFIKNKK